MGNSVCEPVCQPQSRHSSQTFVISNTNLLSGSFTLAQNEYLTSSDSQNILQTLNAGAYMPCYKNKLSDSLWQDAICKLNVGSLLQQSLQSTQDSKMLPPPLENIEQYRQKGYYYVFSHEDVQIRRLSERFSRVKLKQIQNKIFQVSELIVAGPPANLRWSCWKWLLLQNHLDFCAPGWYERCVEKNSSDYTTILKDINRTLNRHPYFSHDEKDEETKEFDIISQMGQAQLIRVLNGVANALPQLGYCQGMNFLVGLLLIVSGSDESLSFSCFLSLLLDSNHMLYFLYCDDMPFHNLLAYFIKQKLKEHFPELAENIQKQDVPDTFWITKMIISLFVYIIDMNNCVRVWDYILSRGAIRAVPEIMVSLMSFNENKLRNAEFEDFAQVFQGFVVSKEKDQNNLDCGIKVGDIIYNAQSKFAIQRSDIKKYTKKFIKNLEGTQYLEFYKLFLHFDKPQIYEKETKSYLKKNIVIQQRKK